MNGSVPQICHNEPNILADDVFHNVVLRLLPEGFPGWESSHGNDAVDCRPLLRPRAPAHGDAGGGAAISNGAISNGAAILLLHPGVAWAVQQPNEINRCH